MAYLDNVYAVVQIAPTGIPTYVRLSQNENGRILHFAISGDALPAGSTVVLTGTKPDGAVYSVSGTLADNVATFNEDGQLTAVAGEWDAKVEVTKSGNLIATGRIKFVIDADPSGGNIPSDSQLDGYIAEMLSLLDAGKAEAYGSPLVASTVAGMTDQSRVYVYTGSETGYTAGNWYYWNGSAWTSGGVYNAVAVSTDTTLSIAGKAADAKATGDAVNELKDDLSQISNNTNALNNISFTEYTPTNSILTYNDKCILRKSDGVLVTGQSSGKYVSDFISIENTIIKSVYGCCEKGNTYTAMSFYSSNNEASFISSYNKADETTTYWQATNSIPIIPDGAKYIRVAGYTGQFPGTPTITLYDTDTQRYTNNSDFNKLCEKISTFSISKNLVGMDTDTYYPVSINPGDVITLSTSTGATSTANDYIEFYGENDLENRLTYVTMTQGLSKRTWEYNGASKAYYAKWYSVPTAYKIQIEYGNEATDFVEYFGNSKYNYSLIQDLTPKGTIKERDQDQVLNIRNASGLNRAVYGKHDLNLLLMSDLHEDDIRMKNAFIFAEEETLIDGAVNLGDTWGYSPNLVYVQQKIDDTNLTSKPTITVLGNHDQRVDSQINITTKQVVDAFLRETNSGDIYEDNGCCYYDFDEYNVRVICLNSFDMPDTKESGSYIYYGSSPMYQQAQISWFINTLSSVPENYTVIIVSHYVEPTTLDQSVINTHPEFIGASYNPLTTWGSVGRMSGTIISDIVDAYITKTTISETYSYSMDGISPGSVSVNADFSNSNGDFACYLCGHMHCHAIGHITNHTNQVVYFHDCSRATINNSSWTTVSSMFSRDTETRNQDLITVFSIDTVNKLLKFVRIGAHVNVFGEDYNIVVYKYGTNS